MRKFIKATVLTLALAIPASAGEIGNPVAPPGEIGNPIASSTETEKTGDMGAPLAGSDIAITLLKTLLVLF